MPYAIQTSVLDGKIMLVTEDSKIVVSTTDSKIMLSTEESKIIMVFIKDTEISISTDTTQSYVGDNFLKNIIHTFHFVSDGSLPGHVILTKHTTITVINCYLQINGAYTMFP